MSGRTLKRRLWLNLALLAIAGILVLVVIYEPGKSPPPELPPISQLDFEAIHRVAILRPDAPPIRFEKQDGAWRMTTPRALRAGIGKLDDLLQFPAAKSQQRYPLSEVDQEALGLTAEAPKLKLNDTVFTFGGTEAIHDWRYVRVRNSVHLVQTGIYNNLLNEPLYWVDTRLLPEAAEIVAISLPEIQLVQTDGVWQAKPEQQSIGSDAIVQLVQRWQRASALSVHPLDPSDKPSATVKVQLAGRSEPVVFKVIELKTGFELARPQWNLKYRLTEFQYNDLMRLDSPATKP